MSDQQLKYRHEIKLHPNWDSLRAIVIFVFFDLATSLYFLYQSIFNPYRDGDLLSFLCFFTIGLIVINIILWNIRGREIIEITDEKIIIRKIGKLFPSSYVIEFFEMESISIDASFITVPVGKLYRLNAGKIIFKYLGMEKKVGQTLQQDEANKIVNDLNTLLATLNASNE